MASDLKYSCLGLWVERRVSSSPEEETQELQKPISFGIILHGIGRSSFIPEETRKGTCILHLERIDDRLHKYFTLISPVLTQSKVSEGILERQASSAHALLQGHI